MGAGSGTSFTDVGTDPGVGSQIGAYRAPIPSIVQKYMQNLGKGGFLDMPGFNELFGSYNKVANREANRQSAAITESFGSQGGRYSSDLLASQANLRSNVADNLANKASEYQLGLRKQQADEVGSVANLQYGANEAAMSRFWQDFLRRTSPPPLFNSAVQTSSGFGLPPLVV